MGVQWVNIVVYIIYTPLQTRLEHLWAVQNSTVEPVSKLLYINKLSRQNIIGCTKYLTLQSAGSKCTLYTEWSSEPGNLKITLNNKLVIFS